MNKTAEKTEMPEWLTNHPLTQAIMAERAAKILEKRLKGELLPCQLTK